MAVGYMILPLPALRQLHCAFVVLPILYCQFPRNIFSKYVILVFVGFLTHTPNTLSASMHLLVRFFDGLLIDSGHLVNFGVVLDVDGESRDYIGHTIRFSSSSVFSSLLNSEP